MSDADFRKDGQIQQDKLNCSEAPSSFYYYDKNDDSWRSTVRKHVEPDLAKEVYEKSAPSVVQTLRMNWLGRGGTGSGFVADEDGHIVTCFHCVDGATELAVITASGEYLDATVSDYDRDADIAILKVKPDTKKIGPALAMVDESTLKPRDLIFALGHPKGDLHTYISAGSYLASCDRFEIENYFETTIQKATSAPSVRKLGQYCLGDKSLNNKMLAVRADIYHGNSGGPIVNARAEVIGVVGEGADDDPVNGAVPASIIRNLLGRVQADERAHNTAVTARSKALKYLYGVN